MTDFVVSTLTFQTYLYKCYLSFTKFIQVQVVEKEEGRKKDNFWLSGVRGKQTNII